MKQERHRQERPIRQIRFIMTLRSYLSALAMLALLSGCGGGGVTSQEPTPPVSYAAAKQTWQNAGIQNYRFTLQTICFCIPEEAIRVVVTNGQVSSATFVPSGAPLGAGRLNTIKSLSGLFDTADQAYARGAAQVRFTGNGQYGYIENLYIDYDAMIADEEIGYTVTDFAVDAIP